MGGTIVVGQPSPMLSQRECAAKSQERDVQESHHCKAGSLPHNRSSTQLAGLSQCPAFALDTGVNVQQISDEVSDSERRTLRSTAVYRASKKAL